MFMRRLTNGNIRGMFDITMDSLMYLFDPERPTVFRNEGGVTRRIIGREGDLRLFFDASHVRSLLFVSSILTGSDRRLGNSLLYNTLECVKLRRALDDTFYGLLAEFGHQKKEHCICDSVSLR